MQFGKFVSRHRLNLTGFFLAVIVLLFTSCENQDTNVISSEQTVSSPPISSSVESTKSESDEQTQEVVEPEYTTLPAWIRSENLLFYTYQDEILRPVDFQFRKPEDYNGVGYSDEYAVRFYKFSDNIMTCAYQDSTPNGTQKTMIYNCELNTYTDIGHSAYPTLLDNGEIALITPNTLSLYKADGTKSDIQLEFDWGRVLTQDDEALDKTLDTGYNSNTFPEREPIGLVYDTKTQQYVLMHIPSPYMAHEELPDLDLFHHPVSVSLFNQYGKHNRTFLINDLFVRPINKGYTTPPANTYMRQDGKVLFIFGDTKGTIDLISEQWTDGFSNLPEQEPVLIYDKGTIQFYYAQPECPVRVECHPDGTKIYPGNALLKELDSGYSLAFYTFNSDGSCNLIFEGDAQSIESGETEPEQSSNLQKIFLEAFEEFDESVEHPTLEEYGNYLKCNLIKNNIFIAGDLELWAKDIEFFSNDIRKSQLITYPVSVSEVDDWGYYGVDRNNGFIYCWERNGLPKRVDALEIFPTPLSVLEYVKANFWSKTGFSYPFELCLKYDDNGAPYYIEEPRRESDDGRTAYYVIDIDNQDNNSYLVHSYSVVMESPDEGHTATTSWLKVYKSGFIVDGIIPNKWIAIRGESK